MAVAAATAFAAVPALGASSGEEASIGPATPTVYIKDGKGGLRFVAPESVVEGEELRVVNQTNPKKVGPHTFSLVTPESVPKTKSDRHSCFTPKHICMSIAKWHGFNFKTEKITINPAEAGLEGWSTEGSVSKKGDSWFTGEKPGTSITQQVNANTSVDETVTIHFICAIHPWMHGSIKVLPVGSVGS
jgi:hypothetical protein